MAEELATETATEVAEEMAAEVATQMAAAVTQRASRRYGVVHAANGNAPRSPEQALPTGGSATYADADMPFV